MIQEKDFLYRVPVKTAPITTPRGQIRNPEILVDLEGGEFMHGNILDANSTNKLINQSVKDAVDDKFIESGHVTKDLLEAETSARTKGDEDLGAKIQAEQTRAEGKEKEISDKLAIALANEVTRATGAESGLQAAIATKADATALSNYVLTTALNQFVLKTELPTVPTKTSQLTNDSNFIAANHISDRYLGFEKDLKIYSEDSNNITTISHTGINFETDINDVAINQDGFFVSRDSGGTHLCSFTPTGIRFADKTDKDIPTADGTFINVNDIASADDVSSLRAGLSRKQNKITVNEVDITDIETADITKLRTIVTNLINALSASDLIRETETLE